MLGAPLVSVVMSVFNGERFLADAVESILDQSFRDFEFIVIDDGSTDHSGSILDSYQKGDPRVRVHHQENSGLIYSLNHGCGLARGKYIARMDADDIAVTDRLMWQADFMETHGEVAVLGGAVEFIDEAGRMLESMRYPVEDHEIKSALFHHSAIAHPAVCIRKEALASVGGYRTAFVDAEDYDLWLRMAEGSQFANLEWVVIKYRVHSDQVSRRKLRQQTLSTLAAQALASSKTSRNPKTTSWAGGITPAALTRLGVSEATQERALATAYLIWIERMSRWHQDLEALSLADDMLRTCRGEYVERRVIADAWLATAQPYWRQRRPLRSLFAVGHAVMARPLAAGRPLKHLLSWIRGRFRACRRSPTAAD